MHRILSDSKTRACADSVITLPKDDNGIKQAGMKDKIRISMLYKELIFRQVSETRMKEGQCFASEDRASSNTLSRLDQQHDLAPIYQAHLSLSFQFVQ